MTDAAPPPAAVRLDVWLDVACLFKTRSEAQRAIRAGRVLVNDEPAKSHRLLKPGDRLVLHRALARDRILVVLALADRHVAKAAARMLYDDQTPEPTLEEKEARRIDWLLRDAAPAPEKRPDRRERAELRRLKGRDDG